MDTSGREGGSQRLAERPLKGRRCPGTSAAQGVVRVVLHVLRAGDGDSERAGQLPRAHRRQRSVGDLKGSPLTPEKNLFPLPHAGDA